MKRIKLTPQMVNDIYNSKLLLLAPRDFISCFKKNTKPLSGHSTIIAKKYNVSPKTVRDIWNNRTWTSVTHQIRRPRTSVGVVVDPSDDDWSVQAPYDPFHQSSDPNDPFHDDWPYWDLK
jgi:hypothetical protein